MRPFSYLSLSRITHSSLPLLPSLSLSLSLSLSPVSTLNSLSLSFFLFNVSVDDNCLKGFQVIQAVDKRSHPNPNRASNNFLFLFQLLLGFSFYYYSLLLMTSVTRFEIMLHFWKVLGNFWGFILYFAKYWTYCGKFFYAIRPTFYVLKGQMLKTYFSHLVALLTTRITFHF